MTKHHGFHRRWPFVAGLIGVLLFAAAAVLSRISGPRKFNVCVGTIRTDQFAAQVRAPSTHAWLAGIALTCEANGFPKDASFEVRLIQSNAIVFRKKYTKKELVANNWIRGESFTAPLSGGTTQTDGPPLHKRFGFGHEFRIEVDSAGREARPIEVWIRFVDDRLIKPSGPHVIAIDVTSSGEH